MLEVVEAVRHALQKRGLLGDHRVLLRERIRVLVLLPFERICWGHTCFFNDYVGLGSSSRVVAQWSRDGFGVRLQSGRGFDLDLLGCHD